MSTFTNSEDIDEMQQTAVFAALCCMYQGYTVSTCKNDLQTK